MEFSKAPRKKSFPKLHAHEAICPDKIGTHRAKNTAITHANPGRFQVGADEAPARPDVDRAQLPAVGASGRRLARAYSEYSSLYNL